MRGKKGSKGQEEAPIELLIAVTLLTFVMILGIYAYQNMCRTQFEQKMKSSVHSLVATLESVYHGPTGSSQQIQVDFTAEGCGTFDEVRFFKGTQQLCEKQVGFSDCLVVAAVINSADVSKRGTVVTEAMNIPASIAVEYDGFSNWENIGDFFSSGKSPTSPSFKGAHLFTISKKNPNTIEISG